MKNRKEGKVAIYILGILIVGLGLYIGSFLLDVGGDLKTAHNNAEHEQKFDPALQALVRAEKLITSDNRGTEHGNTLMAKRMALQYSVMLGNLREKLFTEEKEMPVSLSNGVFLTYCNLKNDSCVFIVHVPQLRDYTEDAKALLHEIAWAVAIECASINENINKLALGVRGALIYDAVLIGDSQAHAEQLGHAEGRKALKGFF